jgi:AraC-like DNA-binding protein
MAKPIFDAEDARILKKAAQWKIVAGRFPPDVPARKTVSAARRAWSAHHGHRHAHREFLVALRGETVCTHENDFFACRPGTVFFFDIDEKHDNGYAPGAPDLRHLWITVMGNGVFLSLLTLKNGAVKSLCPPQRHMASVEFGFSSLQTLLEKIATESAPPAVYRLRVCALLQWIVAEILRQTADGRTADILTRQTLQAEAIRTVCRHLEQTSGKGVTLTSLARLTGYSPYHFLRLFRQHAGCSVHEYVNRCRMNRVKQDLARHCQQKEISENLGFSCPAAFSRWYRQMKCTRREPDLRADPAPKRHSYLKNRSDDTVG